MVTWLKAYRHVYETDRFSMVLFYYTSILLHIFPSSAYSFIS